VSNRIVMTASSTSTNVNAGDYALLYLAQDGSWVNTNASNYGEMSTNNAGVWQVNKVVALERSWTSNAI